MQTVIKMMTLGHCREANQSVVP